VRSALQILTSEKSNLVHLQNILALRTPLSQVHSNRQRIDELTHRIDIEIKHTLELRRSRLEVLQEKLLSMNPLIVLQRGYAVVVKTNGQVVRSIKQIKKREPLNVRVTDGQFAVKVNDQTKGSHGNL
jgi:exodeoxyribonuclease VII large subunit